VGVTRPRDVHNIVTTPRTGQQKESWPLAGVQRVERNLVDRGDYLHRAGPWKVLSSRKRLNTRAALHANGDRGISSDHLCRRQNSDFQWVGD